MVKTVDTRDLKSLGEIHPGSIPGAGTKKPHLVPVPIGTWIPSRVIALINGFHVRARYRENRNEYYYSRGYNFWVETWK